MGRTVIDVRGFKFAIESKSESQRRFIYQLMCARTDEQLAQYQKEYEDGYDGSTRGVDPT